MKRKGMKREYRDSIALAVIALDLIKAAKKSRFSKRFVVEGKYLNALGWAIRKLDPHVQRWVKKNGGKL